MCDWVNWLVFDILGDLCFGKSFNMKEPGSDLRHIPEMMISFLELVHPVSVTTLKLFKTRLLIFLDCMESYRLGMDLAEATRSGLAFVRCIAPSSSAMANLCRKVP
jgi:hypothetical protein